jgi:hypothetical protein
MILPLVGLALFGGATHESLHGHQYEKVHGQYFWWASIPLDTHQVVDVPSPAVPCKKTTEDCASWEPRAIADPGLLTRLLVLSAFPAFLVGMPFVRLLGRYAVSEVWAFFVLMPILITAWYCAIGLLIDRWMYRRSRSA